MDRRRTTGPESDAHACERMSDVSCRETIISLHAGLPLTTKRIEVSLVDFNELSVCYRATENKRRMYFLHALFRI